MISQTHIARRDSMEGHCLYHPPVTYWDKVQAVLISHLVVLNGHTNLVELEVRIGRETLLYSADRSGYLKAGGVVEDIRDRSMLTILASTYEALSQELVDPEWVFRTNSYKRRKLQRPNKRSINI